MRSQYDGQPHVTEHPPLGDVLEDVTAAASKGLALIDFGQAA
jgi:hypothetical protein